MSSRLDEFVDLLARLEAQYSEPPGAFERHLVRALELLHDSAEIERAGYLQIFREILIGERLAPSEMLPFLMWQLRWPEVREMAIELHRSLDPERRPLARHLHAVVESYDKVVPDAELFESWLKAANSHSAADC